MNPECLLQHFERISEAPDAIPRLRRFILDLAVRGKLVEQDPSDEPAAELLSGFRRRRRGWCKNGMFKDESLCSDLDEQMCHLLFLNLGMGAASADFDIFVASQNGDLSKPTNNTGSPISGTSPTYHTEFLTADTARS